MPKPVTNATNDHDTAVLTSATGPAPVASSASSTTIKTTQALLAEHGAEIDAEIARRRSSSWPDNGGSP